jgi:hypothetical protein
MASLAAPALAKTFLITIAAIEVWFILD